MAKKREVNIEPWESESEIAVADIPAGATAVVVPIEVKIVEKLASFDYVAELPPMPNYQRIPRHVDVNLDAFQADTLLRLGMAMDAKGERLRNGKRIVTRIDTIRRVLEIIAEATC